MGGVPMTRYFTMGVSMRVGFLMVVCVPWMALGAGAAEAKIVLSGVFSDHAVLQRGKPIHVWGATVVPVRAAFQLRSRERLLGSGPRCPASG